MFKYFYVAACLYLCILKLRLIQNTKLIPSAIRILNVIMRVMCFEYNILFISAWKKVYDIILKYLVTI